MISVEAARAAVLELARPGGIERVALAQAAGRVLAEPVRASRDQPPFDAAAMDGYAVAAGAAAGERLHVIGEAGAGHAFAGRVGAGETVRIFTGAPVPAGATHVVIQEDVTRDGDAVTLADAPGGATHIRSARSDFAAGDTIDAPRLLDAATLALLAAMNVAWLPVRRRPVVALIATGDELVMPGETPRHDQIVASNIFALKAIFEAQGAEARLLPIARDTAASLRGVFALADDADMIVTVGGASAGDHDIVGPVAAELGMERAFYKIAMRPGKPLMAGRMGGAMMLGLPGNPVSAIVCAHVFAVPALRRMLGRSDTVPAPQRGRLTTALPANGPRAHYMRARLTPADGPAAITPFERQDSALLSVLSEADALLIRPVHDPARGPGDTVHFLPL